MYKLISSTGGGEPWLAYAARAARYGEQLQAIGLPEEHPERIRARESYRRGLEHARRERRQCEAARRIVRALEITKKKKSPR